MSSELRTILNKVVEENYKREENAVEEAFQRYKSLLLKIAGFEGTDVLIFFEGTKQADSKEEQADLCMLEKASLIKGNTKNTNHNTCRQYELTKKGAELVEKFSKETMSDKEAHQPHTLGAPSSQEIPVRGAEPNQVPCPVCGKTFKTNSEMERHRDATHHETKGHE